MLESLQDFTDDIGVAEKVNSWDKNRKKTQKGLKEKVF